MNTPIKREDIRAGDKFRRIVEITAACDLEVSPADNATYELIERPVQLPTEPGWYEDALGSVWKRAGSDFFLIGFEAENQPLNPVMYAPFTLLRPVAEVAAEVADWMDAAEWSFGNISHVITNTVRSHFGVTK